MILKLTREINREVRSNCMITKICTNVCVRYRYNRAKHVVLVTFIIDNRVILVILFLVLIRYVCIIDIIQVRPSV